MTEEANNVLKFPEPKQIPAMPKVLPPIKLNNEHYRIGWDSDKEMAVLALIDNNGHTFGTLAMNQPASEQLIRMIRAAFPSEEEMENSNDTI